MLKNQQPTYEEQQEGQEWQDVMREAAQQAAQMEAEKRGMFTSDDTHHRPARSAHKMVLLQETEQKPEERQPDSGTVAKVMKKTPEKKRCGWPGMRYMPLPAKKKKGLAKKV